MLVVTMVAVMVVVARCWCGLRLMSMTRDTSRFVMSPLKKESSRM